MVLGEAERRSWSPLGAGGCWGPQMLPPTHQGVCLPTRHSTGETTTAAGQWPEVTRWSTLGSGQHKDRNPRRPEPWSHLRGSQGCISRSLSSDRSSDLRHPPRPPARPSHGHDSPPGDSLGQWCSAPNPQGLHLCSGAGPWLPATTVHFSATLTGSCVRVSLPMAPCAPLQPPASVLPPALSATWEQQAVKREPPGKVLPSPHPEARRPLYRQLTYYGTQTVPAHWLLL